MAFGLKTRGDVGRLGPVKGSNVGVWRGGEDARWQNVERDTQRLKEELAQMKRDLRGGLG